MQEDLENEKTTPHATLNILPSKPLSSIDQRQMQQIRVNLLLLNTIVWVMWIHLMVIIIVVILVILFFHQLGGLISRTYDSYFDYLPILATILNVCSIVYATHFAVELGFKLKRFMNMKLEIEH